MVLNKSRNRGVTVYGAISACFAYPVFRLYKSTNSTDFLSYLAHLREALLPEHRGKSIKLVLDGARAHSTLLVRAFCQFNDIEIVAMPSYSPEFNSIESLWAVIKRRFKHRLVAESDVLISQPRFEALLGETLASITPEEGRSAARNNRDFLFRTLTLMQRMQLSDQNLHSLQLLDVVHEESVESGSDS